ncbi:MAG TPA: AraC family transcriptional regulator [Pyrinomonadaceae bacterium]|nr:AraC family transcriptional regulator [Pyrinomonadaceae bacterium]
MQIEWKSDKASPYLFTQTGEWPGVRIRRVKVLPGRMLEHTNDFHEINVGLAGSLTTHKLSASGRKVATTGGRGNLCITPAGQPISADWDRRIENLMMTFDRGFIDRAAAENGFARGFEFREIYKGSDPLIQHLGLTLLEDADSETSAGRLFTDSLLQTLTLHLLNNYGTSKLPKHSVSGGLSGFKLRRVKEFIAANLDADLSLAEIAAVAELSQFHFARAFRKTTGLTPQQFVMQQRIERAKELLAKDDLPIVEVSLLTGFKNQSHFTSLFRKFTRLTPKVWRTLIVDR